jgi:hypothetical protein
MQGENATDVMSDAVLQRSLMQSVTSFRQVDIPGDRDKIAALC